MQTHNNYLWLARAVIARSLIPDVGQSRDTLQYLWLELNYKKYNSIQWPWVARSKIQEWVWCGSEVSVICFQYPYDITWTDKQRSHAMVFIRHANLMCPITHYRISHLEVGSYSTSTHTCMHTHTHNTSTRTHTHTHTHTHQQSQSVQD